MIYAVIILLLISVLLLYMQIEKLKKRVEKQQKQIDALCEATEKRNLTSYYISDDIKAQLRDLKNSGKEVEAVKKVREMTTLDLLAAKQYVDKL